MRGPWEAALEYCESLLFLSFRQNIYSIDSFLFKANSEASCSVLPEKNSEVSSALRPDSNTVCCTARLQNGCRLGIAVVT